MRATPGGVKRGRRPLQPHLLSAQLVVLSTNRNRVELLGAHAGWPGMAGWLGLRRQSAPTAGRRRGDCRRTDRSKQHSSHPTVATAPQVSFRADSGAAPLIADALGGWWFPWKRNPSKTTRMAGQRRSRPPPVRRHSPATAQPRFFFILSLCKPLKLYSQLLVFLNIKMRQRSWSAGPNHL